MNMKTEMLILARSIIDYLDNKAYLTEQEQSIFDHASNLCVE